MSARHPAAAQFRVIAHRGTSAEAPENTLAAFQVAIDQRATAVEMDLRVTADGRVVVLHDNGLDRTTNGRGPVGSQSYEEVRGLDAGSWYDPRFAGAQIPTLDEVFAEVVPQVDVVLHIKDADKGIEQRCVDLAHQHDAVERVTVSSASTRVLQRVAALDPEIARTWIIYVRDWAWWVAWIIRRATRLDVQTLAPKGSSITPGLVRSMHRAGLAVRAWGAGEDEVLAARLIECGVDGMSFDAPGRLWTIWEQHREDSDA